MRPGSGRGNGEPSGCGRTGGKGLGLCKCGGLTGSFKHLAAVQHELSGV